MTWYQAFNLLALTVCTVSLAYQFFRLLRPGFPTDFSPPAGSVNRAIGYAFTGAMSPRKKETAFLHLPTYVAGIIYHVGTFLSILIFLLIWAGAKLPEIVWVLFAAALSASVLCGVGMLVKRGINKGLRELSNPDDYISNILVTGSQAITILVLLFPDRFTAVYYLFTGVFMLYLPTGKLKHLLYFFSARMQLGFFFGRRGVWPPVKLKQNRS